MADTLPSTNMALPVPVVGIDPGPQWATDINSCFFLLDLHDHSSGYGVPISPSGLNISSDLSFQSNNATSLRSARFALQSAPLGVGTDLGCIYGSGVDLYYNDGDGNQIRLTQNGSIVGTAGSISGLTAPASAAYVGSGSAFVFQSAVNTAANLDGASILLRNSTAGSNALTLAPPLAMGSNYQITLPTIPANTSFVTINTGGNLSTTSQTKGITSGMVADNTLTTSQISNTAGITITQLARANPIVSALSSAQASSGTYVTVVSASITTIGRGAIEISMQGGNSSSFAGYVGVTIVDYNGTNAPNSACATFRLQRDGTNVAQLNQVWLSAYEAVPFGSGSGISNNVPPSSLRWIDPATIGTNGTYTYTLAIALTQWNPARGTAVAVASGCVMTLREL